MAESKIKEVAKILGVEMGERFIIKGILYNPYHLEKNKGLVDYEGDINVYTLNRLLIGELEIEKPILDEAEKRYLEGVLKPFKDRIFYLTKKHLPKGEYIYVSLNDNDCFTFPFFKHNTMYKSMEPDRSYTLEELGLFK